MKEQTVNVVKSFKPALVALLIALIWAQTPGSGALAKTQTAAPAQKMELASSASAEAKRGLERIGTPKYAAIKDARMRDGLRRAVNAVKALSRNTSRSREAGLVAELERTVKDLKALPQPKSGMGLHECDASYERCIELCKEGAGDCKLCAISNNLCYLNQLTLELVHEGDPKY